MLKFLKKCRDAWNGKFDPNDFPIDPIQVGMKVMYLDVEWTVTRRMWSEVLTCHFVLERINDLGQHESVSPIYNSDLVKPIQKTLASEEIKS